MHSHVRVRHFKAAGRKEICAGVPSQLSTRVLIIRTCFTILFISRLGPTLQAVAHLQEEGERFGLLLGCTLPAGGGTAVLGCARMLEGKVDWDEEARTMSTMLPAGIQVVGIYSTKEHEQQLPAALIALRTHLTKLGASFAPATLLAAVVTWDPEIEISCAPLETGKSALTASVSPHIEENAEALMLTAMLTRLTSTLSIAPGDASAALVVLLRKDASFCVLSPKEEETIEKLVLLSSHGASACSDLVPPGPAESSNSGGKGGGGGKGGKSGGKGSAETGGGDGGGIVGEKALLKLEQVWAHGGGRFF